MKTLELFSLKSPDIIKEMAEQLNTKCIEGRENYILRIPETFGNGYIKAVDFENGMDLLIVDCTLNQETKIHFLSEKPHPLKFSYCLKGNVRHKFMDEDEIFKFSEFQSSILSNAGKKPHETIFEKNTHFNVVVLQIEVEEFNQRFNCYIEKAHKKLRQIFSPNLRQSFYYQGPISVEIRNHFQKIDANPLGRFTERLFMEAFAYHLMVIQLLQFEDDQREDDQKVVLRQFEVEAIHKAALLIEREMENPRTIPELCRKIGLNQNKLQSGFQLIFNTSVNEYIHKERMKKAMYLLNNTNASMREIMEQIGLNSQSYFSKIFKIAYGCSPSEFRKIHKKR